MVTSGASGPAEVATVTMTAFNSRNTENTAVSSVAPARNTDAPAAANDCEIAANTAAIELVSELPAVTNPATIHVTTTESILFVGENTHSGTVLPTANHPHGAP